MMRIWLVLVAVGAVFAAEVGCAQELQSSDGEELLLLPDGRALPSLPLSLEGAWARDELRVVNWKADLNVEGNVFEGRVSIGDFRHIAPLTVQGTRTGDVIEFSVRMSAKSIAHFAGHVAGTSVVGVIEGPNGEARPWAGTWVDDTVIERLEE